MSDALAPILVALAAAQTLPSWDVDDPNGPSLLVFDISGAPKQTADLVERFEIWSTDGLVVTADAQEIRLAGGVVLPSTNRP